MPYENAVLLGELFELRCDLLMYEVINNYFEGEMQACPIAVPRNRRCVTSSPCGSKRVCRRCKPQWTRPVER